MVMTYIAQAIGGFVALVVISGFVISIAAALVADD